MLTRRLLIPGLAATAFGPLTLTACSSGSNAARYEGAAHEVRQAPPSVPTERAQVLRELIRYASLAPSSHNTQCWTFHPENAAITISPDFSRLTPAVDPDNHHLYASLGCATENLLQAAPAHGFAAELQPTSDAAGGFRIQLTAAKVVDSPLFQAIAQRQCTRAEYSGTAVSTADLALLERAGTGPGVTVYLLTAKPMLEQALAYVVAGNSAQMSDPAFMRELESWIRFDADEAIRTGDGLYSGASGSPPLPRWLGHLALGLLLTAKSENDKYAAQLRSSAGMAVFVSEKNDAAHWFEAGRCYERFALQATALGIRNAMLNQPVEVAALRPQFASFLGTGGRRPDLVARFGYGAAMPQSLRRPVQSVIA
jgi:hypothetical protein